MNADVYINNTRQSFYNIVQYEDSRIGLRQQVCNMTTNTLILYKIALSSYPFDNTVEIDILTGGTHATLGLSLIK